MNTSRFITRDVQCYEVITSGGAHNGKCLECEDGSTPFRYEIDTLSSPVEREKISKTTTQKGLEELTYLSSNS